MPGVLWQVATKTEPAEQTKKSSMDRLSSLGSLKLKKGETLDYLIKQARELVESKLAKYKKASKTIMLDADLQAFFDETSIGDVIALDTETTRFRYLKR